jgi:hypothetical protein
VQSLTSTKHLKHRIIITPPRMHLYKNILLYTQEQFFRKPKHSPSLPMGVRLRQLLVLASHRAQASCSQGFYRGSHCTLSMHIFEPQGPSWITGTHPIHLQVLSEFKNKWIGPKQAQLRLTQTIKGGGDVRESSTYH